MKTIIVQFTIVIVIILFTGCASSDTNQTSNGHLLNEQESNTPTIEKKNDEPIVETSIITPQSTNGVNNEVIDEDIRWTNREHGFALEGKIAEDGLLELTTVKWQNNVINSIFWRNSAMREPYVFVHDLNQDQMDELIVVNILDHGSGFIVTEPHVLNSETSEEIPIESLANIITKFVSFEYENSKNSVVLNGDQVIFSDETEGGKIEAKFNDWLNHTVLDGKLIGSVQVGDGTASGIRGYLNVTYKYETGRFTKDIIEFKEDLPVGAEPIPLTYSTEVED